MSHRRLSIPWSVYLRATPREVQRHYDQVVAQRRQGGPLLPRVAGLREALVDGDRRRLDAFLESLPRSARAVDLAVDVSSNVSWIGVNTKPYLATLTCSSLLVFLPREGSSADARLVLPSELPAIHGISFPSHVLAKITPAQMRSLIGNSMHVSQVGTFLQFAFASRARRSC